MKKLLMSLIIANAIFAGGIIENKETFTKEGKTYFLVNEKEVSGIVLTESDGNFIYSTYKNGNKIQEKVLNNKREITSGFYIDSNELINGKVSFSNEYGETITAVVKNGIVNGSAQQYYFGDFDFDGEFVYGIAHGKLKTVNENYAVEEKAFSNGVVKEKLDKFMFQDYFTGNYTKAGLIVFAKNIAKKNDKPFTGLAFTEKNGYIAEATYYSLGEKRAHFIFENGFMVSAQIFKGENAYLQYQFMKEMSKGIINDITNYSNNSLNGAIMVYYVNGQRMEANYVNGRLVGKAVYYDKSNDIAKIEEFKNDTFTQVTYFDYNKNLKKSEVQGNYLLYGEMFKTGKEVFYNKNQEVEAEILYGENDVYKKSFYHDGKLKSEGKVDFDGQYYIGEVKEYYESGNIKARYKYAEGFLNGKQYYYDESGKEIGTENYDYGYLLD